MYRKLLLIKACLLTSILIANAQSSINAGGGTLSENGVKLSYSVGQMFYNSYSSETPIQESVLQGYNVELISSTIPNSHLNLSLYPNPVNDLLTIEFNDFSNYQYHIYNTHGQLVDSGDLHKGKSYISVSSLKEAIYILKIIGTNSTESYKLKKI